MNHLNKSFRIIPIVIALHVLNGVIYAKDNAPRKEFVANGNATVVWSISETSEKLPLVDWSVMVTHEIIMQKLISVLKDVQASYIISLYFDSHMTQPSILRLNRGWH
ncbi:MAG: hypothetical protein OEV66_10225 [Spirochaetia bacterium]|nr:hypothetical protein [Spirochaetia bacterium]